MAVGQRITADGERKRELDEGEQRQDVRKGRDRGETQRLAPRLRSSHHPVLTGEFALSASILMKFESKRVLERISLRGPSWYWTSQTWSWRSSQPKHHCHESNGADGVVPSPAGPPTRRRRDHPLHAPIPSGHVSTGGSEEDTITNQTASCEPACNPWHTESVSRSPGLCIPVL